MIERGRKLTGLAFILLSLSVLGVSAYVYQQATLTVSQTIVEIATFTVKNSDLGNINEGETITYTEAEVPNLGDAISIDITSQPVYLHFDSDVDSLSGSYSTYDIQIKYATIPGGGSGTVGDTACTLSLGSPDYSSITLDQTGVWEFDIDVTTTASSVDVDTPTQVSITVGAESTS
jgi:hypothetical protein